ncbi:hypothetical protein HC928_00280 [bacterium]|nr:hypothetical protein [bacterium]
MKVKTNLKPSELMKVGAGLQKLAKKQTSEIVFENPAEKEVVRRVESLFDIAVNNLQDEVARVLLEK